MANAKKRRIIVFRRTETWFIACHGMEGEACSQSLRRRCPQFPQVALEEDTVLEVASVLRLEINNSLEVLREIASGKDLKKFLAVYSIFFLVAIILLNSNV
ncbi:hypothetical protein L1987_11818 [Smallanthus sonchifolius]|uniref:Uncharacterized protein n=1 Tax=Smallanthus sonchifolius TaxID=185202 RepID=A0ACB9JCX0_9ASTR|nr:hypothetical protein L1987_11818 [Smallanthus sonchifolius]